MAAHIVQQRPEEQNMQNWLFLPLELSQRKQVHIYTDFKYAFLVLLAYAAIWKELQYLIANASPIKYHKEIDHFLSAGFQSTEVAVIHL